MSGRSTGGDDNLTAAAGEIYGDARLLTGSAAGGDDTIAGLTGPRGGIRVFGDGAELRGNATGGDDTINAYGFVGTIYGDGATLSGSAQGGNDVIRGDLFAFGLIGDGGLSGAAVGGDDRLEAVGFASNATLIGDGPYLRDFATGGDDTLVGGRNADMMWGDAPEVGPGATRGADLFVIAPGGGDDTTGDFVFGQDRLDLTAFGAAYDEIADLETEVTGGGLVIAFADGASVTLAGITSLAPGDVIFG